MNFIQYILGIGLLLILVWAISRLIQTDRFKGYIQSSYIVLFTFFLLEMTLNIAFKLESGSWLFLLNSNENGRLFEKHPYLNVSNRPSIDLNMNNVHFTHNEKGQRSASYSVEDLKRAYKIVCIGGSTTYGVGVDNDETWPNVLDRLNGPDTVVINLSVPGHTSVEHLVSAALYLEEIKPDAIIIHAGLNDMRMSNLSEIPWDYSNFHSPHLIGSMGLCYLEKLPKIASVYYLVRWMQFMEVYPVCDFHRATASGAKIGGEDARALTHYKSNLRRLILLSNIYTERIVFVPQVLLNEMVSDGGLNWWIPFIDPSEMSSVMKTYNQISKEVIEKENGTYLHEVDEWGWTEKDFTDPSHMGVQGNATLARLIYKGMKEEKAKDSTQNQE